MTDDLLRLRSLLGTSAAFWAGESGVRVEAGRWVAFSGAGAADFNVVMCHGASGDTLLSRSLEEIAAARAPGLIMVGGETLPEVHRLAEAGWVCVGSLPFMARELNGHAAGADGHSSGADGHSSGADGHSSGADGHSSGPDGPSARAEPPRHQAARRLEVSEEDAARALVGEGFGISPELALVALPPGASTRPGHSVWGTFDDRGDLVACVSAVRVQDTVAIWSMATAVSARRDGHGTRLLSTVLADAERSGARISLLQASSMGEPFYLSAGYRVLERWQIWSRRRWALGRA